MINFIRTTVDKIFYEDEHITKFNAVINQTVYKCINYNNITGKVNKYDNIILNTTAVDLELGTGGYHFVLCNLSSVDRTSNLDGHIMKLKYTPIQFNCMSTESQESTYHKLFDNCNNIDGLPVIIGTLHSILAPVTISLKSIKDNVKIIYIMTDGGALPIWISDIVRELRKDEMIDKTITCGNAFGGDLECVNIYSALIAAKAIFNADIAVVCMGPGIVGTDTKYGFSGIEQGYIIDAVNKLNGYALAIPRISFADARKRHFGLSHHTITILKDICNTTANIAIPKFNDEKLTVIQKQIEENKLNLKHNIYYVNTYMLDDALENKKAYLNKMGKGYNEDKEYFLSCAASALIAADLL